MSRPSLILITGGIGAGKSVISRILRLEGYEVFDTDRAARVIMDSDAALRHILTQRWGTEAYTDQGILNRPFVAAKIFGNDEERRWLNSQVHSLVRERLQQWQRGVTRYPVFVECAIPTTSLIDRMSDEIWLVTAPDDIRIARATTRDAVDADAIRARIRAQQTEFDTLPADKTCIIVNDAVSPLLPQIRRLLH